MKPKTPSSLSLLLNRCLATALLVAGMALPLRAGVLLDLYYNSGDLPGNTVADLTANPNFPNAPGSYDVIAMPMAGLFSPLDVADNYGRMIRGYVEAPQTGQYTFWIASDDDSELWLSTDTTEAAKVKIAENLGAVGPHNYFAKPAQKSALISLVTGQKYYLEVLHKEGVGGDHVEVAWTLPDGTFQDPVPLSRLWPFPVDTTGLPFNPVTSAPTILTAYLGIPVDALAATTTVQDGQPLDLVVTADGTQPATVQWFKDGVAIPGANLLAYHLAKVGMSQNGATYSVTINNALGSASASTILSVLADTTAPTLVDALNLGNPMGDVAVVFSEGVDPAKALQIANYSINNGVTINDAKMGATPDTVILHTTGLTVGTAYTVTVSGVQDLATTPNVITANSQIAMEQNINTWYRLDETGGTVAVDSSGNGRNGTMVYDAIPGYTGKVLRALKFAGVTGGAVRFPNGYEDFTTGMTVALWARPTVEGAQANWARFIDLAITNGADNILFARTGGDSSVTFEVYKGGASSGKVTTYSGSLLLNQWQHLTATLDTGGNVIIYRNGIAVASGTTGVPNVVNRVSNLLGRSNWGGDAFYSGKMDDVRIYNRVLAPAAVAALANGGGLDDADPNVPSVSVVATVPTTALKNTPPGVFTLTRSGDTNVALTVQYTMGGTATNGVAYTNLSGSVIIPVGSFTAKVYVKPIDYSFQGLQQTAVLALTGAATYTVGDPDSDTVVIQNNDVNPAASLAMADNAIGAVPTTVDVWFAAPVSNPTATALANYTLVNAPGLTITGATLVNRNLRVVLSLSGPVPPGAELAVSGVQDPGGNTAPSQIPIRVRLENPANVVANVYHGATGNRATAFTWMTDGVVNNTGNGGTGFDTWDGGASQAPFAGLLYLTAEDIQAVKVDLGQQFGDGGDWMTQPNVYLLTNAVDSGSVRPDLNTNWVKVSAQMVSGGQFQAAGDPNPSLNTPIVFDLTGVPAAQRAAYGWAVGGVSGNGSWHFLSFTELRGYGAAQAAPALAILQQPVSITVTAGQPAKFNAIAESVLPLVVQWNKSGLPIPDATRSVVFPNPSFVTESACIIPPVTSADNGAEFTLTVNNAAGTLTSQKAILTVVPRTTPPKVVAATYDPVNAVVDVWFDESAEPSSAQTPSNYSLSDGSVSIVSLIQDAQGFHVALTLSGPSTLANLTLTAKQILDLSGNMLGSQTVPVTPLATGAVGLVADAYQQGYATSFARSVDGVVTHDANVTTWTTFGSVPVGLVANSQFAGLQYDQPFVFDLVKVDLGYQYGDGGDWAAQPRVFILKNPVYTAQTAPENDPVNWMAVPAALASGSVFDIMPDAPADTVPPPNTPIAFDLSQLPLSQRTGYGWAVGGAPGNGPNAHFVSLAELRAFGTPVLALTNGTGAPQIVLDLPSAPITQPLGSTFYSIVGASGSQPLHYQWLHNGTALADNGRVTGSQANALTVANASSFDTGTYQVIVTNTFGAATSSVANFTFATTGLNNGAGWVLNSGGVNVLITNNTLTLTDGRTDERHSAFLTDPQYVRAFDASWVYQDVGGGGADGVCFVVQNDPRGPYALGGGGGSLGYGDNPAITPSAAFQFNIYGGNAASTTSSGIGFRVNGAVGKPYSDSSPVNPASGNLIAVTLHYDGTALAVTLKDTVTGGTFSTNYTADLPTLLGTNTAYVGFTGASGGVASKQLVSNFTFTSLLPALSIQPKGASSFLIAWATGAGTFTVQQCSDLAAPNWANAPYPVVVVGSQNQVEVPITGANQFFRIRMQ